MCFCFIQLQLQLQLYFIQICFTQVIVYTIQIRIFCNHIQLRNTSTFIVLQLKYLTYTYTFVEITNAEYV